MKKKNCAVNIVTSPEKAKLLKKIKQLEEKLSRHCGLQEEMINERAEQLSKAKKDSAILEGLASLGKLAENIAHEIRNPLNVISTSAYYLKMKIGSKDKRIKQRIEFIEVEVEKTLNIVDTILNLSGISEPYKEKVNIVSVFNEAISDSRIPDTVKVVKDIPSGEIFINADVRQLNIVFTSIIKNSLDAMNNTGRLILGIKKTRDLKLEISFADTGKGMSNENMDKVFQPLFTTKTRGFGFGLLVCKTVIERHKGEIKIESEPGKGTVVTLIL